MIADGVPFAPNPPGQRRVALDVLADQEERCYHTLISENVENLSGIWVARAIVERQCHDRLANMDAGDYLARSLSGGNTRWFGERCGDESERHCQD